MRKIFPVLSILLLIGVLTTTNVKASEGLIELRSTTGESYRCFAASIGAGGQFRVPITCRDLIYPIEPGINHYVLWANRVDGGNNIKFGRLEFGQKNFNTNQSFSSMFVTAERNGDVRQPEGRVVMQGNVQPITFLDRPTTPTPVPETQTIDEEAGNGEAVDKDEIVEELTTRDKLITGLKRAGIVAFFALIALVGLIFVITRSRG